MLAIVAPAQEKVQWNRTAMSYAERSADPEARQWLGTLYNNMGWDAHDAGDYQEALDLLEKSWDWHRERQTGHGERIAAWAVAKQLRFLNRPGEARSMQEDLLEQYRRDEPGGEGFVREELAELILADGDAAGARPHFASARDLLSSVDWIEPDRLERIRRLAGSE
jgi:tetratricopeptide (TPR) repeat protein